MNFQQIKQKWQTFWRSERGKSTAKILRYILLVVIVVYLIYQLTVIGWGEVWRNLPTNPLFYLLFLVMHFILPSTELFIYRLSLRLPLWEGFKVFTKKKVLNSDVLGYSGEAYFYVWGKKHLKENDKYIFNVIKDNNIISSFASTLMAVLLLTIFTYTGQVNLSEIIHISRNVVIGVAIFVIIAIFVGIYFRKKIISMRGDLALKIFGIHTSRIILIYTLEVLQWMVVLPLVPLHIWLLFLSAKIISSRLPFIPQDPIFAVFSLELAKYLTVSGAAIAGIIIVNNFMTRSLNLILYSYFSRENEPSRPPSP